MTHVVAEKLVIMDAGTTTFRNCKTLSISRNFALILIFIFICCIVATGLLVYHFASCSAVAATKSEIPHVVVHDTPSGPTNLVCVNAITEATTITTETTTIPAKSDETKTAPLNLRLQKSVLPHSYRLKLIPFIYEGNFTFHGEVTILVNVTESVSSITLHAAELDIDKDSVKVYENVEGFRDIPIVELLNNSKSEFFTINLGEHLQPIKQYNIYIRFKGILNDLLEGFYRSFYVENNQTKWIAATQFQPTDARQAFPCFDEPAFKAKFKLSLGRPKHMTAISNMPKIGNSDEIEGIEDYVWDHFQETVPMSTYLLAFVISDFEHISNGTFSVWARPEAISQSKYSLQIGPGILKFYEKYFNISFPLPKIDMIAIPDFSSGAMENWGLITYRESLLLYQEGVSSRKSLQNIAMVIAHELAHQWFGNLVTPSWWSDLWLNEGFATYVEYLGTNAVSPEWRVPDQFVTSEMHHVFLMDALKTSHPISIEVNNTDEINDIFDPISYAKGATIIRMMDHFLTTDVFRRGLTNYLNSRKYGSATQDDLWSTLTEQAHFDGVLDRSMTIKEIMDTWTLQTGFPIVEAHRLYEENDTVTLKQARFLKQSDNNDSDSSLWWIPVTYKNKNGDVKSVWMGREPQITLDVGDLIDEDWMILNINQTGYYRVNYDTRNWELIIQQLLNEHTLFDSKNRAQMIDDSLNLAAAGYLDYEIAMNVTKYLIKENDYIPWLAAFPGLDYLNDMFIRTAHYDTFKRYMVRLLDGLYRSVGFYDTPKDSQLTIYSRASVLSRTCKMGVVDCLRMANTHFENWRNSPNPDRYNTISPNLREIVYCTGIKDGGQEQWEFAWERFKNSNVNTERVLLMSALGCSREVWLLSRYLEWSVTENSGIRKQDVGAVFGSVARNPVGQQLAYRFLKSNWDRLRKYLGSSSMSLSGIVSVCTERMNTVQEIDDLKLFFVNKSSELGIASRTIKQSIEHGEANVQWMERNFDKIVHWLSRQEKGS